MPEPVELKGRSAAPGVAAGPLFRFDAEIARRLPTGDAKREREALEAAVALAIEQIEALGDGQRMTEAAASWNSRLLCSPTTSLSPLPARRSRRATAPRPRGLSALNARDRRL